MKDSEFEKINRKQISSMSKDKKLNKKTWDWLEHTWKYQYQYHFRWLGSPILQYPQDMIVIQELIWKIKPDLIIETGIARGGSIIFSASILELIGHGEVVGIDIDIRKHNKIEIEKHKMFKRIKMIEGSSISKKVINQVHKLADGKKQIMVLLDSNHTRKHVLKEMEAYSTLIPKGSYMIVMDTMDEYFPPNFFKDRPNYVGNGPKTAIEDFMKKDNRFKIDKSFENKMLITANPGGFLKCIKNK